MKNTLWIAIVGMLSMNTAHALTPAMECAKMSQSAGLWAESNQEALMAKLCQGATSRAPATCFTEAKSKLRANGFTTELLVDLCMGATSNIPVECAVEAFYGFNFGNGSPFNSRAPETVALCRATRPN